MQSSIKFLTGLNHCSGKKVLEIILINVKTEFMFFDFLISTIFHFSLPFFIEMELTLVGLQYSGE